MNGITLESLGLNQEQLTERLLDKLVESVLSSNGFDDDGENYSQRSQLARRLDGMIQERVDALVVAIGDKHVLPVISEKVENLVLQETTKWGEKTGKPVTFIEYMIQRAERYMTDEVNFNGKTKEQDGYSWSKHSTRVVHMVHQHLHFQIETAMKTALVNANSAIAQGIQGAVKIALDEVVSKLTVSVKTK
jgi:hypothetical protein